jgi:hypothetical protein
VGSSAAAGLGPRHPVPQRPRIKQPATLHEDELEYQEGWKERRARLDRQFTMKPPLSFSGNGHGGGTPAPASTGSRTRPDEID